MSSFVLFLSFLLRLASFFSLSLSLSSICTPHTSILYYVGAGALNPALPLFGFELMYTTLQLSETGNISPPSFFISTFLLYLKRAALDFCETTKRLEHGILLLDVF